MSERLDDFRLLGRSGLRVSPLSLGTMTFGVAQGWGSSDEEAGKIFNHYVESGGNSIDTANFYGNGGSERVLAKLLQGRRDQLVVATKYSLTMRPGDSNASGNHRKNMVQSVERSLERLQTDYIDLLYLHMWDSTTPVEEVLRAFDDLVRGGKILYAGLSDIPAWQGSRMQAIAELRGWTPLIALQIAYNLTERTVERELIPMGLEMGMGVLPWSPLAGGVLSGKYTPRDLSAAQQTGRFDSRKEINLSTGRLNERNLGIAAAVATVADEMHRTSAQVALAWTRLNSATVSPIIGARTLTQLKDNLMALEVTFSTTQIERLESASHIDLGFPHSLLAGITTGPIFGNIRIAAR